jgi:FkbM family methyltransferase
MWAFSTEIATTRQMQEQSRPIESPLRKAIERVASPLLRPYFRHWPAPFGKDYIWRKVVRRLNGPDRLLWADMRDGMRLAVDTRDTCGRIMYFFGIWEPNLTSVIRNRLQPGDGFIDIGANIGYYSVLASGLIGPQGRVIAIEAIPQTLNVLEQNLRSNHCNNVRTISRAAWDCEEPLTFYISSSIVHGTSTILEDRAIGHQHREQECVVEGAPVSSLLDPQEISSVRIVKMDVEGAEARAVRGLDSLILRGRPDIEFGVEVARANFGAVTGFFRAHGFHAYHIPNDYRAAAYVRPQIATTLRQIDGVPAGIDELDLLFSRTDSRDLAV